MLNTGSNGYCGRETDDLVNAKVCECKTCNVGNGRKNTLNKTGNESEK